MGAASLKPKVAPRSAVGGAQPEAQRAAEGESGAPAGLPLFLSGGLAPPAQPKLRVGRPGDAYEQEADRVADQVVRMPQPPHEGACTCGACPTCRGVLAPGAIQRAPERAAPAAMPAAVSRALATPGRPLDAGTRAFMEPRFGRDFGGVRVHDDHAANAAARALSARAFTHGSDLFLARGESAGDRLLVGHELAHTVQQARGVPAPQAGLLQRKDGPAPAPTIGELRLPFYQSADPLGPYTVLREAFPDTWTSFDTLARTKTLQAATGEGAPLASPQAGAAEASVTALPLIRPKVPALVSSDTLRARLWPAVTSAAGDPDAAGAVIRDEIVVRWALQNPDLVNANVHIRLLEPEQAEAPPLTMQADQLQIGEQQVLTFTLNGQTIDSADGSLPLLELDLLGSNNIETIMGQVGEEAYVIATAADLKLATEQLVASETDFWANVSSDPDDFARNTVEQHYALFNLQVSGEGPLSAPLGLQITFFLHNHPEYQDVLGDVATRVGELSQRVREDYQAYQDYFASTSDQPEMFTMRQGLEGSWRQARELWQSGSEVTGALAYGAAGAGEALYFLMNAVSFGYPEARHQAVGAFRSGQISYRELEDLSDAAAARGAAVGMITLALTAATAGLAGPVLGTSATLGQKALFFGAAGAVTNIAAETTGSAITSGGSFENPAAQAIWAQGERTLGQLAFSGAVGFGLGAGTVYAGAAIGKLVSWLRRPPAGGGPTALAQTAEQGMATAEPGVAAPPGWNAEQIADDIFRLTRPDLPGEVIVTPTSLRYQTPAGTGMRVEFEVPLGRPRGLLPPAHGEAQPPGVGRLTVTERVRALLPAGQRYIVRSLDDVAALRANPPAQPSGLDEAGLRMWDDYMRYYRNRLDDLETQLTRGSLRSEPPRTWESYLRVRTGGREEVLRGRAHQARVTESMAEVNEEFLTASDVGVSRVPRPGQGEVKFTDQLIMDRTDRSVLAVSNKSRNFAKHVEDYTQAELELVRDQVRKDVNELFEKYSGQLYIRRPEHPLFGQRVNVKEVILIYENDAGLVNRELAEIIISTARSRAAELSTTISFHVSLQ